MSRARPARRASPSGLLAAVVGRATVANDLLGDLHEEFARLAARLAGGRHRLVLDRRRFGLATRFALGARCAGVARSRAVTRGTGRSHPAHATEISVMHTVGIETRYALRALWKRPGLSALIVLTLALWASARTRPIFATIDALILRPFPFPTCRSRRPRRRNVAAPRTSSRRSVSPANFLDWKPQTDVLRAAGRRSSGGT